MFLLYFLTGFALKLTANDTPSFNAKDLLHYSPIYDELLGNFITNFETFEPFFKVFLFPTSQIKEYFQTAKEYFDLFSKAYPKPSQDKDYYQNYVEFEENATAFFERAKKFMNNQIALSDFLPKNLLAYFEFFQRIYNHLSSSIVDVVKDLFEYLEINEKYVDLVLQLLPSKIPLLNEKSFSYFFKRYLMLKKNTITVKSSELAQIAAQEDDSNAFRDYVHDTYLQPILKQVKTDKGENSEHYQSINTKVTELEQKVQDVTGKKTGEVLATMNIMEANDFNTFVEKVSKQLDNEDALSKVNLKTVLEDIPSADFVSIVENLGKLDPTTTTMGDIESALSTPTLSTTTSKKSNAGVIAAAVVCSIVGAAGIAAGAFFIYKKKSQNKDSNNVQFDDEGNDNIELQDQPNEQANEPANIETSGNMQL